MDVRPGGEQGVRRERAGRARGEERDSVHIGCRVHAIACHGRQLELAVLHHVAALLCLMTEGLHFGRQCSQAS